MDMILTGRGVEANEALAMGLANRVVPKGQARQQAEELAAELAALPQQCMRSDRLSALNQWGTARIGRAGLRIRQHLPGGRRGDGGRGPLRRRRGPARRRHA